MKLLWQTRNFSQVHSSAFKHQGLPTPFLLARKMSPFADSPLIQSSKWREKFDEKLKRGEEETETWDPDLK